MPQQSITRHLTIRGRVQRVGFRASMAAEADRLGVKGWVRNRCDGAVEAVVQGPADVVGQIIAWARRGPPQAGVVALDATAIDSERFTRFERRPTE